ncbi:hypothetical protein Amsp01_019370 [Amycolatopsis sp. NBRC 101858]|uniref:hypothetical protein n=1 Tax=Amycolatopsis sp. NBRC 101858 TaxID=3032200 RepID=UPI0024A0A933|nr:hypothetical protein [Amycolatopsis sp. NBRC 101858]GLY35913.1 hypothetical protein Amsp01_019370 [Amycolatopsis sp. NBRC 101858]
MSFDGLPVAPVRTLLSFERGHVDIRECTELPRVRHGDDLTGVIELTIGQVALLGPSWESEIEGLWGSVADLVAGYRASGRAEVSFPDQPADITLEPVPPGLIRITVAGGQYRETAVTGEERLLSALTAGGVEFFEKFADLTGRNFVPAVRKLTRRSGAGRTGPSA